MKKALLIILAMASMAAAQTLGDRYFWAHKIPVSTTAVDSTFSVKWEFVTIYSDTLDLWLKVGAPDTSSWSSRDWIKLEAGTSLYFEAPLRLRRLSFKTVNGSGYMYMLGGKKQRQY